MTLWRLFGASKHDGKKKNVRQSRTITRKKYSHKPPVKGETKCPDEGPLFRHV